MSDYLADEFVAETILWRLPVKSIMQCRCVCKSWNSLITSRSFISSHQLRSKTLTPKYPQIFIGELIITDCTGKCLLHFDKEDHFLSMSLRLPHYSPHSQIVGSAKGLICFSLAQGCVNTVARFILFNPSVGRFQAILPPSVRNWEVKGFGFDERTQDYNILLTIQNSSTCFIYSLNSNSWRSIINTTPSHCFPGFNLVVFTNGRFHWLARQHYILSGFIRVFDLKTETFGQIPLPDPLSTKDRLWRFTEFGESSLAVIEQPLTRRSENNIWVLKEYGSVQSWIKLATINLSHDFYEAALGFRNEDEVLIKRVTACITSENINRDGQVRKVMHVGNVAPLDFTVHTYMPSLALLDKQNNVDVAVPTCTIVDISAPTRHTKGIKKSVADESPAAQVARRSKRIKHQLAKYTDVI